jgi:hypothetical protein
MTKIKRVLVFLIISTGCLFSQSERNEILEEDTITPVNTAVVTEVDLVVIEESVSEPEEKKDLSNYGFYNAYLDYVKKTNSIDDIGDASNVFIPKREKLCILLLETGVGFYIPNKPIVSLTLRAPISNYFHILIKHDRAFEKYSYTAVMLGYSFVIKRSIIDISVGPCLPQGGNIMNNEGLLSTTDIAYYYRVSKSVVLSATIGSFFIVAPNSFSIGLGYTL